MKKIVVALSGGIDSTVLLHDLHNQGHELIPVGFNYGQKHRKELLCALHQTNTFSLPLHIIDLQTLTPLLRGSALTDKEIDVPEGHYESDEMKDTVVPNRNMMFASIAASVAIAQKADGIAFAAHAGDHAVYPDCRSEFWESFVDTLKISMEGFLPEGFEVMFPYVKKRKEDIVLRGYNLNVDFTQTWSCYKGRENHCGLCGTCQERKEAFGLAKLLDPTVYENVYTNFARS